MKVDQFNVICGFLSDKIRYGDKDRFLINSRIENWGNFYIRIAEFK